MLENINRLSTVDIDSKGSSKLIQVFNSNRGHGHDGIPFRILKTCGQLVIKPLPLLFGNCISHWVFPSNWKKASIIPAHVMIVLYHFYRFALKFLKN